MKKSAKVMICVTRQKACERLIRKGHSIAQEIGSQAYVIHIAKGGENFLGNPREGEALDYLFQISKQFNAEMTVVRSDSIIDTLVEYARKEGVGVIVLGETREYNRDSNIIRKLESYLYDVEFVVVPAQG